MSTLVYGLPGLLLDIFGGFGKYLPNCFETENIYLIIAGIYFASILVIFLLYKLGIRNFKKCSAMFNIK